MKALYFIYRRGIAANARWQQSALVLLSVGLLLLSPCAVQGLSLLRAAQNETNERSECETNERYHASAQSSRHIRAKGTPAEYYLPASLQSPLADCELVRAVEENRQFTPPVVGWSATMRC